VNEVYLTLAYTKASCLYNRNKSFK